MIKQQSSRIAFVTPRTQQRIITQAGNYGKKLITKASDKSINFEDVPTLVKEISDLANTTLGNGIKTQLLPLLGDPLFATASEIIPVLTKYLLSQGDEVQPNLMDQVRPRVHKYHTIIGVPPKGKFKGESYDHEKKVVELIATNKTYSSWIDRQHLVSRSGFNEKSIDFFDSQSFLTFKDIAQYTKCKKNVAAARAYREKQLEPFNSNDGFKNLRESIIANTGTVRAFSLINKIQTTLVINCDSKAYLTNVRVHLCVFRNYRQCPDQKGALTTDELIESFLKDLEDPTKSSIKTSEYISRMPLDTRENPVKIKQTIITQPYADILKNQTIKDHIQVINTYYFELKPSETGIVEIDQFLTYGIDLFDLEKYNQDSDACFHTFFIVESVGSTNAQIQETKNPNNRFNGAAPTQLRYEFSLKMKYRKLQRSENPTEPDVYRYVEKNENFDDYNLAIQFCPNKTEALSVDASNINTDGRNPEAKYTLCQDNNSLIVPTLADKVRASTNDPTIDVADAQESKKNKRPGAGSAIRNLFGEKTTAKEEFKEENNDFTNERFDDVEYN